MKPRVENIGYGNSSLCTGAIYVDDELLVNFTIPSLPPRGVYIEKQVYWVPEIAGSHEIKIIVDTLDEVDELREDNYEYTRRIDVRGEENNPPEVNLSYTPTHPTTSIQKMYSYSTMKSI